MLSLKLQQHYCAWFNDFGEVIAMLVVQITYAASQIFTKMAINNGAFLMSLLAYRHVVAVVCIAPLALLLDRGSVKKLANFRVWLWAFLTALTGITMGMGLFYYGLRDTSATYATNFSNLIPIITFIFCIIVRMENLGLKKKWGKLKVLGTIICVGGAITISLYKGPALFSHHHNSQTATVKRTNQHRARGTILIVSSCLAYTLWFIFQAKLVEELPSKQWGNLLTCLVASVQTAVLGLCFDRRRNSWKIGWDVQLATIVISGALASAASFYLLLWTIERKGPSYPSLFDPLSVVFVAIIEAIFFGEALTVGILLGMSLMIVGLYCYLWGKRDEELMRKLKGDLPTTVASECSELTTAPGKS